MLKVNDSIRNAYKQKTTQRKSYIKVGDNSFFIQNLDVSADAYDEGNVIGNAIAKIAKFDIETEYVKGLDEFELFDGIWTGEKYEYVSLGTFKLFEEQGTDEFFSSITSYDKLVLFNKPYDNINVKFPISLYDFLKEICSQANVELETKRIANGDKILFQNLFVEGETLKQILKAICQISGNFAKIKNDKLVLGLYDYDSYIATGNEIVLEDYYKDIVINDATIIIENNKVIEKSDLTDNSRVYINAQRIDGDYIASIIEVMPYEEKEQELDLEQKNLRRNL